MPVIELPHNFKPREYQLPLWNFLDNGFSRALVVWHRRAGKDVTMFNLLAKEAVKKKGTYWYLFPTYAQAKKVIWDGINKDGFKFRDYIPRELKTRENGTDLTIELVNGSIIQLIGTDKIDNIRGVSLAGCVFSEFAFQNPIAWDVIRPILAESGGWAIFNSTPNGKNHFYDLYHDIQNNNKWFTQILTVDDTKAVSGETIQEDRESGMSEQMIQQEYYCSFDVGAIGSFYADLITNAKEQGRITTLPNNTITLVDIYFDLGRNDSTAIWFKQDDGQFYNFIGYTESNGKHITSYFDEVDDFLESRNLKLGKIYFPHDSKNKTISSYESTYDIAKKRYGHKVVYIERTTSVIDDINKVRSILSKCRFDKDMTQQGIRCLENYKREYDTKKKIYKDTPYHDWSSHGADSFRYFAVTQVQKQKPKKKFKVVFTDYSDYL